MEELKKRAQALVDEYANFDEENTDQLLEDAINIILEFIKA